MITKCVPVSLFVRASRVLLFVSAVYLYVPSIYKLIKINIIIYDWSARACMVVSDASSCKVRLLKTHQELSHTHLCSGCRGVASLMHEGHSCTSWPRHNFVQGRNSGVRQKTSPSCHGRIAEDSLALL
jgi:hypothetical protein